MKERIIEFLKAENKTSAQLAEEIGVQPSGISHILSGRNKPSLDFILKMLEKYNFLSTEWLLLGKGDMYREPSLQKLFDDSKNITNIVEKVEKQPIDDSGMKSDENAMQSSGIQHKRSEQNVEKIVWFYKDNSFREYLPEND